MCFVKHDRWSVCWQLHHRQEAEMMQKIGISLHWTAGGYMPNYIDLRHYHGGVETENQGVVQYRKWNDYNLDIPHTWRRNGELIGLTICGMVNAHTRDFGKQPIIPQQVEELCLAAAEVAELKNIPVTMIRTHAEWAIIDGYGPGSGDPETRWDLSILEPGKCDEITAHQTGNKLRGKITWYRKQIRDGKRQIRPLHLMNKYLGR